ncbi:Polyketide synthase [Ophiocordyceps camponoti-floridani]|uniref:Polyketide synthase n=1 Tax=Ophiocordyceps camponoti-floridani TaxID=2030778 RepID=A0A8H4Q9X6_9HYPO|nr:Polyketide synthase [Ophiocordyceps camponoti-floridani]
MAAEQPSLLVCGPLITNPDEAHLSRLRSLLLHDPVLADLREAVAELPHLWALLLTREPSLQRVGAGPLLEILAEWLTAGTPAALPFSVSRSGNALLAVLTVLDHILEYIVYLNRQEGHDRILESVAGGGIQGLCVGLLSAVALACSTDKHDVSRYGAVAVRLALCVGAFVDLDESCASEPSVCLSARWPRAEDDEDDEDDPFKAVLDAHPQAYTSVRMDASSITITAPRETAMALTRRLQQDGAVVKQMDLRGRFHHESHWPAYRKLSQLCSSTPMLRFPAPSRLLVPVRSNDDGLAADETALHEMALRCILVEKADWYGTLRRTLTSMKDGKTDSSVLVLGPTECVPRSVLPASAVRTVRTPARESGDDGPDDGYYPANAVAIIGASCRFPLSETLHEFWTTIRNGRSGNSLSSPASFDRHLFGKSAREADYLDPQHRLGLHLAYEALESAGRLGPAATSDNVGCYVGMSSSDYGDNVTGGRAPTAFSYTGTARAFASGQISHFFGLTGPSMVVDTACSSSAVAIHVACAAIQAGECTMALAGGLNISGDRSRRNLGAASFLSRSGGPCRPFDAGADGYCPGQGGGFVLLKGLAAAVAENDCILGVLAASAVNHGKGSRSITLPSSESQSQLFSRVLRLASLPPRHVSYVEAHGTGTQKGDPVEMQSIRRVFGRGSGSAPLRIGSVKGNVGHAEAASGVASLLKVLLMLRHELVPPQAGFSVLNPGIPPLETAGLEIPVRPVSWPGPFRTAMVSNYGASGANVAMIVCQPPPSSTTTKTPCPLSGSSPADIRLPILITAHSASSLQRYCQALLSLIAAQRSALGNSLVSSVAFGLAQRQNHRLAFRALFSAASTDELVDRLSRFDISEVREKTKKPVVLLFAGQTGRGWRLSRAAYTGSRLLRRHLDHCDRTLQTLGLGSLFPFIFNSEPVEDVIQLHCIIFSLQYAVAASWIDAGLEVAAIIGHSLGQLTALCTSGVLSLRDAIRLISGRAALIRDRWGPERGCMLRVDADIATTRALIERSRPAVVEMACYNASAQHVVVGTAAAIAIFEEEARSAAVSFKRLAVSHGFHSEMVDRIVPEYRRLVQGLVLRRPSIPLEACTESGAEWADMSPELIVQQSREPVFFAHALSRVEQRLGACVWLEAGSGSVGVTMARRALESRLQHSFHSVQLDDAKPMVSVTDTTLDLWRQGVRVQFWPFHASQRPCYAPLELPPYQFDMSEYWLPIIDNKKQEDNQAAPERPKLVSLIKQGADETVEFVINQHSEEYAELVGGRTVLGHVLAPASVYIEAAGRAFGLLPSSDHPPSTSVEVGDVKLHAPFGLDHGKRLRLMLKRHKESSWHFAVESQSLGLDGKQRLLSSGTIRPQGRDNGYLDPSRPLLLRLGDRCEQLRDDRSASVVQGAFVKRMMSRAAAYDDGYFGIQSITSKGLEAVGCVSMPSPCSADTVFSPPVFDNFLLVAELHASSLAELGDDQVYVCCGFDVVIPQSSCAETASDVRGPWTVLSSLDRESDRKVVADIFVFSAVQKALFMAIMGVRFSKVQIRKFKREIQVANGIDEVTLKASERSHLVDAPTENTLVLQNADELSRPSLRRRASLTSLVTSTDDSIDSPETPSKPSLLPAEADFAGEKQAVALLNLLKEHVNSSQGIPPCTPLSAIGLDSLSAIQLQSDMEKTFGKRPALTRIDENATFSDLYGMLCCREPAEESLTSCDDSTESSDLAQQVSLALNHVKQGISASAQKTGFADFFSQVHSEQTSLVQAYILEAFGSLGCDLSSLREGDAIPGIDHAHKYARLLSRFHHVLEEADLVTAPDEIHGRLLAAAPRYRPDLRLLDVTGSRLADCLSGRVDPLHLIFQDEASIQVLEDVYVSSPMFATGNQMLGDFISRLVSHRHGETDRLRILEIGAGTGATTQLVVDRLLAHDVSFTYTFTDVSVALTASARKKFKSRYGKYAPSRCNMDFTALDIEKPAPASMLQSYDVVISSNCIHATRDLQQACANVEELLRRDGGVLCLLELTRPLAWLDCTTLWWMS